MVEMPKQLKEALLFTKPTFPKMTNICYNSPTAHVQVGVVSDSSLRLHSRPRHVESHRTEPALDQEINVFLREGELWVERLVAGIIRRALVHLRVETIIYCE